MFVRCLLLCVLVSFCASAWGSTIALARASNDTLAISDSSAQELVYYGVNTSSHESRSQVLRAAGYRIVSLSIYGSKPNIEIAAVWSNHTGPSFETIAGVDETTYDNWYNNLRSQGYVSTLISATGSADNAVFAGVMELKNVGQWEQRCNMTTPYGVSLYNVVVKAIVMYGLGSDIRYCVLQYENQPGHQQTYFVQTQWYQYDYDQVFASETQRRFWRPVYLGLSDDHLTTPIFDDTSVGEWAAFRNLTVSELNYQIKLQSAKGLAPIHLEGSAYRGDTRYNAIFGEESEPLPRVWSATGSMTGFKDNEGVTTALDVVLRNWMQANGVRQAQVAVALKGTLLGERAYTWAESDRGIVQPDDKFLLASVSKMFTHAAIQRLINSGRLNMTTKIFPAINIQPADERANAVDINNLVSHTGGWDRTYSEDYGFSFTSVALTNDSPGPATLEDVIRYAATKPLDFEPGTSTAYSNFGTMLLSYLVTPCYWHPLL
jgi:hypothetical protein